MITRRQFLKNIAKGLTALALPVAAIEIINPKKLFAARNDNPEVRWVFLVDTYKCVGCGLCVEACKKENEIPYDANVRKKCRPISEFHSGMYGYLYLGALL